jgi:hypothetical protein
MVTRGLALVQPFDDNRGCVPALLAAERQAQAGKIGLWAMPETVLSAADQPGPMLEWLDRFRLVQGKIVSASVVSGRLYVNFGRVWREDFTAIVEKRNVAAFAKVGLTAERLQGLSVRVRGWLQRRGGPAITLTYPEQLEVIEP